MFSPFYFQSNYASVMLVIIIGIRVMKKKAVVKLPFPMPSQSDDQQALEAQDTHSHVRPKPEQYADRTWMPPRGTRRSMGKR